MKRVCLFLALAAMLWFLRAPRAAGWAMDTPGNEPLSEMNYRQWPGIMPLVNDKARVYETWANGNEHLFYRGNTTQLIAALAAFEKVKVKHHVVVLRPGPPAKGSVRGTDVSYNWVLHVLGGLAGTRANDNPEDLEWQKDPVLTVYVGGDIDLDKIEIPAGVTVRAAPKDAEGPAKDAPAAGKIAEFIRARSPATQPATRPAD